MTEALPESPVPEIAQEDLGEVPGIETNVTKVSCYKIDPLTGERDPESINLTGIISVGKNAPEGGVRKANALCVFSHERDATSHTSPIDQIDEMSDGSFWLRTGSGSVYRLEVVSEVEAKTEEKPVKELCDQSHDGAENVLKDE